MGRIRVVYQDTLDSANIKPRIRGVVTTFSYNSQHPIRSAGRQMLISNLYSLAQGMIRYKSVHNL